MMIFELAIGSIDLLTRIIVYRTSWANIRILKISKRTLIPWSLTLTHTINLIPVYMRMRPRLRSWSRVSCEITLRRNDRQKTDHFDRQDQRQAPNLQGHKPGITLRTSLYGVSGT